MKIPDSTKNRAEWEEFVDAMICCGNCVFYNSELTDAPCSICMIESNHTQFKSIHHA